MKTFHLGQKIVCVLSECTGMFYGYKIITNCTVVIVNEHGVYYMIQYTENDGTTRTIEVHKDMSFPTLEEAKKSTIQYINGQLKIIYGIRNQLNLDYYYQRYVNYQMEIFHYLANIERIKLL